MRFEGKHKLFKNVAKRTSFKNIMKTLTEHHQRLLAFNLHYDNQFAAVTVSTGTGMYHVTIKQYNLIMQFIQCNLLFLLWPCPMVMQLRCNIHPFRMKPCLGKRAN